MSSITLNISKPGTYTINLNQDDTGISQTAILSRLEYLEKYIIGLEKENKKLKEMLGNVIHNDDSDNDEDVEYIVMPKRNIMRKATPKKSTYTKKKKEIGVTQDNYKDIAKLYF